MKQAFIVMVIGAMIVVATANFLTSIFDSPEYAVLGIMQDVENEGISGVYEHLTEGAKEKFKLINVISEKNLIRSLLQLANKSDYIGKIKTELGEISWEIKEIEQNRGNAKITIGFDYHNELRGEAIVIMQNIDGEWKISDMAIDNVKLVVTFTK